MGFEGKVVIVTGAARGIGLGIARAFVNAGATVVASDRDGETLSSTVERLQEEAKDKSRVKGIIADVSRMDDVQAMVGETVDACERIDILVNNAGFGMMNYFWEMPEEEWAAVVDTTLTGTFRCSREAAKVMIGCGIRGRIINIASTNAVVPSTGISAYCAAKGGVAMFTRAAAVELGPHGITINAIGPGTTMTPITEAFYNQPGLHEAFLDRTPLGRYGQPEDIARVAVFLASDDAAWVTGQLIMVDGGQSLLGLPRYLEGLQAAGGVRPAAAGQGGD